LQSGSLARGRKSKIFEVWTLRRNLVTGFQIHDEAVGIRMAEFFRSGSLLALKKTGLVAVEQLVKEAVCVVVIRWWQLTRKTSGVRPFLLEEV
jgi:hypothetical protein